MPTKNRVLVVRTVHHETGNATASELNWLLGRLRPEVIFLEHSAAEVSTYPAVLWDSLELAAVARYQELNVVEVVPLGIDVADAAELRAAVDAMLERVEEASSLYYQVEVAHCEETARGGLAFLNSPMSATLQSRRERELRATVEAMADPVLTNVYARWVRANDLREAAFVSGVEVFARSRPFHQAVLLVGAAHWQPLIEKTRARAGDGSRGITWEFEWELDEDRARA